MNNPILTTRQTNKTFKLSAVISGIADVVFVVLIWTFFKSRMDALPQYMHDDFLKEAAGAIVLLTILIGAAVIYTAYQFLICRSYVDVYEDRMRGMGIQDRFHLLDFDLSRDKITNVTSSGIYVFIHTPGGKYKIVTNAVTAQEVVRCFHNPTDGGML